MRSPSYVEKMESIEEDECTSRRTTWWVAMAALDLLTVPEMQSEK
jgi:hypothetical protein